MEEEDENNILFIPASQAYSYATRPQKTPEEKRDLNRKYNLGCVFAEIREAARCYNTEIIYTPLQYLLQNGDSEWLTSMLEAAGYKVSPCTRWVGDPCLNLKIEWGQCNMLGQNETETETDTKNDDVDKDNSV